jgi:hypothetical protein
MCTDLGQVVLVGTGPGNGRVGDEGEVVAEKVSRRVGVGRRSARHTRKPVLLDASLKSTRATGWWHPPSSDGDETLRA